MDVNWCLTCQTHLSDDATDDVYCSPACRAEARALVPTTSRLRLLADDDAADVYAPSSSRGPAALLQRIQLWRDGVPAFGAVPHPCVDGAQPRPAAARTAALETFARPQLLRKHTQLRTRPTFQLTMQPDARLPHGVAPLPARAAALPRPVASPLSSVLTESPVATPASVAVGSVLLRVKAWLPGSAPAARPRLHAMESTSTLVDDALAACEKKAVDLLLSDEDDEDDDDARSLTPTSALPTRDLSRLVALHSRRHRASRPMKGESRTVFDRRGRMPASPVHAPVAL